MSKEKRHSVEYSEKYGHFHSKSIDFKRKIFKVIQIHNPRFCLFSFSVHHIIHIFDQLRTYDAQCNIFRDFWTKRGVSNKYFVYIFLVISIFLYIFIHLCKILCHWKFSNLTTHRMRVKNKQSAENSEQYGYFD